MVSIIFIKLIALFGRPRADPLAGKIATICSEHNNVGGIAQAKYVDSTLGFISFFPVRGGPATP
jgi:hypothetical protein